MGFGSLRRWRTSALLVLLLLSPPAVNAGSGNDPAWRVCFTPGQDCTGLLGSEIAAARRTILVQAYSFTSVPILTALKAAHARGVDVEVIVDKTAARASQSGSRYSAATYLSNAGIPVWVDAKVAIAHNKVMVIDGTTLVTGSFNFTASAQNRNAENLLVVRDPLLAARYGANWESRRKVSVPFSPGTAAPPATGGE